MEEQEAISVNCKVDVHAEDGIATVTVPPEIRLTERLVSHLHAALKARDLELKHWTVNEEQEKDLEKLSNVVIQDEKGE
jgi:cell fate regulator YaaT (PSP1 superfamily)